MVMMIIFLILMKVVMMMVVVVVVVDVVVVDAIAICHGCINPTPSNPGSALSQFRFRGCRWSLLAGILWQDTPFSNAEGVIRSLKICSAQ